MMGLGTAHLAGYILGKSRLMAQIESSIVMSIACRFQILVLRRLRRLQGFNGGFDVEVADL